jgi:hypothetical protein
MKKVTLHRPAASSRTSNFVLAKDLTASLQALISRMDGTQFPQGFGQRPPEVCRDSIAIAIKQQPGADDEHTDA